MAYGYETEGHRVWMDERGIVHCMTKPNAVVTIDDAREFVRQAVEGYEGKMHPVLIDMQGIKSITREARAYYAGPDTAKVSTACALVVTSPMAKAVGNFFMGLNQSMVPTRLFNSEAQALEWLQQYI